MNGSPSVPGAPPAPRPALRSFARRGGRMTRAQRRALDTLWQRFGLSAEARVDLPAVFGRSAPCVLEIGFGMGDSLALMAAAEPATNFIGVEVYEPGIGRLLNQAEAAALTNLRVIRGDAAEVLPRCIAPASLRAALLYFPDPWPKKRHLRRRLLQPGFAARIVERLEPGGRFELATDVESYAQQMLEVLEAQPGLRNVNGAGAFGARSARRALTKFERRGERLGHQVRDLVFEREAGAEG